MLKYPEYNTNICIYINNKYLKINKQIFTNYLIGICNDEFNINGSDVLLNYKLMEDICLEK